MRMICPEYCPRENVQGSNVVLSNHAQGEEGTALKRCVGPLNQENNKTGMKGTSTTNGKGQYWPDRAYEAGVECMYTSCRK
jgi:hypothetical protein